MTVSKGSIAALLAASTMAAGAYAARGRLAPRAPSAAATELVAPRFRAFAAAVATTGVIRLRVGAEVRVGAQVSGIVERLNATVGSHVRKGDLLAKIDSREIEARLAQARAQVAVAEQDVRRAGVELARAQTLLDRNLVPREQVEDLRLAADAARAQLEKSRRDAAVVETDLAYTAIRAPITGIVASVSTQEGETVAASFSTPTFVTIIADHALELVAMVDETDIANVAPGDPVTFNVEADPSRPFDGRVLRIAPKATIVSGVVNYEVEVAIEAAAPLLKPDMTANISIRTAERQALMVPDAAVRRDGESRFVEVDSGGRLVRRPVTIGVRDGGYTEVKKGISASDRVAVAAQKDRT